MPADHAITPRPARAAARPARPRVPTPPGPVKREVSIWSRWLHVYCSMIALLVVLFFGITGITLNHPTWTFGDELQTSTFNGTLPFAPTTAEGGANFLQASEFVRDTYGVKGTVDSFDVVNGKASVVYKDPGYAADLFFDVGSGAFDLTIEQQGWVAVLNDLHKGRDTGNSWRWVIDISAGFLVVISITGLVMQVLMRKRRRSALIAAAVGTVLGVLLIWLTVR